VAADASVHKRVQKRIDKLDLSPFLPVSPSTTVGIVVTGPCRPVQQRRRHGKSRSEKSLFFDLEIDISANIMDRGFGPLHLARNLSEYFALPLHLLMLAYHTEQNDDS